MNLPGASSPPRSRVYPKEMIQPGPRISWAAPCRGPKDHLGASIIWGSFKKGLRAPFKRFEVDIRQVKS